MENFMNLLNRGMIVNFIKNYKAKRVEDQLEMENKIVTTGDAQLITEYAKNVKNADVEKLQNAVETINDVKYIYKFACDVKNANIEKLQAAYNKIVKIGSIEIYGL